MTADAVRVCGICRSPNLWLILDMGDQPLSERLDSGEVYPLRLLECGNCGLVQASHIVDQREVFPPDHPYATGNTRVLREHFSELAMQLVPPLKVGDLVVDIGANDGTLLKNFTGRGLRLVGVEPTNQYRKFAAGIHPWHDFFTAEAAKGIVSQYGNAKVVTACNVLAHVPDPHDFMYGVNALLAPDGVLVTENHDWASVNNGLQIDTIYHEHLRYYSVASLSHLLDLLEFDVISSEPIPAHGGSFRIHAAKRQYDLRLRAREAADLLHDVVKMASRAGAVYGIGATTRATPLIHYAKIAEFIDCVCEIAGSEKLGHQMPGTTIPIVDEEQLFQKQPEYALLFAWHIAGDLIPKLIQKGYQGKFIVPLPKPEVRTYG